MYTKGDNLHAFCSVGIVNVEIYIIKAEVHKDSSNDKCTARFSCDR